jgi:hypothetical protein
MASRGSALCHLFDRLSRCDNEVRKLPQVHPKRSDGERGTAPRRTCHRQCRKNAMNVGGNSPETAK